MKKYFLLAFLFPFSSFAQTEHALLWKVSKKGNPNTSYLFGSIHSNDSTLNTFDKTWWKAFNSCKTFAGEVNFSDPNELMASFSASMMKDKSLSELYTPEEFQRVQKFILDSMDPTSAMVVTKLKPFYIMAAIMELPSSEGPYTEIMDVRLQNLAVENKCEIVGLESVAEQAAAVDVISIEEQAKMLLEFVDSGNQSDLEWERMEKFYLGQNLDSLANMETEFNAPPELMESILRGRNEKFVTNLLPHIEDTSVFCAVGALHLPGESGLIAQLRKRGYVVEAVSFRFAK